MNKAKMFHLPKILDERGNLSFVEEKNHIPFFIKRLFWIYDVPGGMCRGAHAFRNTEEFIIALSGSFDVILDDGMGNVTTFHLSRSYYGVYVPKMMWRVMDNFSTNSLALVLSSTEYKEEDYIFNYDEFQKLIKHD
jgi:oxalate decarboxylase/phosphoglucose isomerase-like protein (cupin superfamily)